MDQAPPIAAGRLASVNVAKMRLIVLNGRPTKTGIYKHPIEGRVEVAGNQVGSDRQGNYEVHGGSDKAVYAYAAEDYTWWGGQLGRDLGPGTFGENLTVEAIDVTGARVGERWRVGSVLLEVSEPRIPCSKLAYRMEDPTFVKRFAKALRPGCYLRIVEEGAIEVGEAIEVVSRPDHDVTMELFCRAYFGERELLPRVLAAGGLSERWRQWAEERRGQTGEVGA